MIRIWTVLGSASWIRKVSHFSRPLFVSQISRWGLLGVSRFGFFYPLLCVFWEETKPVGDWWKKQVETKLSISIHLYCWYYVALNAARLWVAPLLSWAYRDKPGLVGFGFVAIASDIHACTQSRCLTGAYACKRVGSVVVSTLDWSICACFFAV